ncbi:MAG: hypothetical protein HFE73_10415 [Firmicutes bacterium]|jgi:uncharacterized YkwD family protein|nr:hypothetical protein [Bacillota bacterium]
MKKKLLTVLLSLTLVLGTTSGAFGAEKDSSEGLKLADTAKKIQTVMNVYWAKYVKDHQSGNQTSSPDKDKVEADKNDQDSKPSTSKNTKQSEVVKLVNEQRKAVGLSALKSDSQLQKIAQMKAEDMAKNRYFSHQSPTYGSIFDMLKKNGVSYKTAGENIARGQKTAQSVMNDWMKSSGHKQNILSSGYKKIGVGYATDKNGKAYWVQVFMG